MFTIPTVEYEKRRSVFDFYIWFANVIKELDKQEDFDLAYFERKGKNIKKLLEEAKPVAFLGLSLLRPGDEVFITCFTGNQPFDALIEVQGWNNYQMKVEVTTTETDDSTLRRQALSRNGYVSTGSIRREDHVIINELEMVNVDEAVGEIIDLAYQRFLKKVEHGYDNNTSILVFVGGLSPFQIPLYWRDRLVRQTREYIQREAPELHGVYYCYGRDFAVDAIPIHKR